MTESERGRDKEWDTSRIKEWFSIIKQIEVITAAYPQSTNCTHSASLWCYRLQTVTDGLITVPQWNKLFWATTTKSQTLSSTHRRSSDNLLSLFANVCFLCYVFLPSFIIFMPFSCLWWLNASTLPLDTDVTSDTEKGVRRDSLFP